jgi:hypothetical protein
LLILGSREARRFAMSVVNIPIATSRFLGLVAFLSEKGSDRDPVEVIDSAIDYWMENAGWKPEVLGAAGKERGYSWKTLFLPDGTYLRMRYASAYHYAVVEGDQILHDGVSVSPNQFALRVAGSARDAWRDVWVQFPDEDEFTPASDLRNVKTR